MHVVIRQFLKSRFVFPKVDVPNEEKIHTNFTLL